MELKFISFIVFSSILQVLIVPLWNWNITETLTNSTIFSFNRTFMELKFGRLDHETSLATGFNRTFMELKSSNSTAQKSPIKF